MTKNTFKNRLSQIFLFGAFFLIQINIGFAEISVTEVNNATPGNCDGKIKVEAEGTASPFTVLIESDNGYIHNRTNINGVVTFNNLCAGTYQITVTNKFMCETMLEATMTECSEEGFQLGFTKLYEPTSCGSSDGGIRILGGVSGGTEPYTFEWNNGMTGSQISGLESGTYIVTITDAIGCTDEETFDLMGAGQAIIAVVEAIPSCTGLNNGEAEVAAYSEPFGSSLSYKWSNEKQTEMIKDLSPGYYCVTVTNDDSGCTATDCVQVISESPNSNLTINEIITPTCPNTNEGSISLNVQGGNPPYEYEWDTSAPGLGSHIFGKTQGIYCTTVTDHCNNSVSECFTIGGPPSISTSFVSSLETCPTKFEGWVAFNIHGGLGPYNVETNSPGAAIDVSVLFGQNYVNINQLPQGDVQVTITDACGQKIVETFNVPSAPTYLVENYYTCELDVHCQATGERLYALNTLSNFIYIESPSSTSYNCVFYKVCNEIVPILNPSQYGILVSGNIVETGDVDYNGNKCVWERECVTPTNDITVLGAPISYTYAPISTNPVEEKKIVVEKDSKGNPYKCVDRLLCGDEVVWTSAKYFCGIALHDDSGQTGLIKPNVSNPINVDLKRKKSVNTNLNEDIFVDIFPNPFSKEINLTFHSNKNQTIQLNLYNLFGEIVWQNQFEKEVKRGENNISVNINKNLASGLYIFEIINSEGEKFINQIVHENND